MHRPLPGDAAAAKGDPNANPPKDPNPNRAVHPVAFGTAIRDHPAGSAAVAVIVGARHPCAIVPANNRGTLPTPPT